MLSNHMMYQHMEYRADRANVYWGERMNSLDHEKNIRACTHKPKSLKWSHSLPKPQSQMLTQQFG